MKYLSKKKFNILATVFISIICSLLLINSGVLDNAGMAVIIMIWVPTIIGICTIVAYLITYWITKKYAFVTSIIGNLANLILAIGSFWN